MRRVADAMSCELFATASRRDGFTIVELVVVFLLLAVATAVTVPALLPPPEEPALARAELRMRTLMQLARDSAARTGEAVTIVMDSASGNVWMLTDGANTEGSGEQLDLPYGVMLTLHAERATFRFLPQGTAFGDSLTLRNGTVTRTVTVDPWTAQMRYVE